MLLSMTGYGKAELNLPDKKVTIEIKSLNSKNMDTNIKCPMIYREKELEIRKMIQESLKRGKVDCTIYYELNEGVAPSRINQPVFESYYRQISELREKLEIGDSDLIAAILKLPDTIHTEKMTLEEGEWQEMKKGLESAISDLQDFRKQEGDSMEKDLTDRIHLILELLASVEPYEGSRIEKLKERINKSLEEIRLKEEADNNRFEQEMIFYLEKLDITEEKTRLENHCRYFMETINTEKEAGKKLNFISQEIGREINTLGSKANQSDIQHIVVRMKDELEKIKELVLNVL